MPLVMCELGVELQGHHSPFANVVDHQPRRDRKWLWVTSHIRKNQRSESPVTKNRFAEAAISIRP